MLQVLTVEPSGRWKDRVTEAPLMRPAPDVKDPKRQPQGLRLNSDQQQQLLQHRLAEVAAAADSARRDYPWSNRLTEFYRQSI